MKKHIKNILPVLVFAAVIFGLGTVGITAEEKPYSTTEKRELATRPKLKWKTVKNGKFQEKYEASLSDQFPARDAWVQLQTAAMRLIGKQESNGVYFGADGYLLEHYEAQDFEEKQTEQNIEALADFVELMQKKMRVSVMMVPTKTWLLQEKLPMFAPTYQEQLFFDRLQSALGTQADQVLVPVARQLAAHTDEEIYYRTDHHWTTLGAWYGYEAYAAHLGKDLQRARQKKVFSSVSDSFYGSGYAKVHQANQPDTICAYEPKLPLEVVYNMGEKQSQSLYEPSALDTDDAYSYFTGGNQAIIEITGGEKNGQTLLVIKDSFANCMLPFLAEDYERVVVADLRQLNVDSVQLVEMFEPTELLILYNSAQFASDIDFLMKWD